MLRDQLNGVVQVARLDHQDSTDLLLGLRIWAVRYRDLAILPLQRHRPIGRLKRFARCEMPMRPQLIVIAKALVEHAVPLFVRHALELPRLAMYPKQMNFITASP